MPAFFLVLGLIFALLVVFWENQAAIGKFFNAFFAGLATFLYYSFIAVVVVAGVIGLGFLVNYLYDQYQEHRAEEDKARADLKYRQCAALGSFLQALCTTYGRYDTCLASLNDWYEEHKAFITSLVVFCRRATRYSVESNTNPLTMLKNISVDTDTLTEIPDADRTAVLDTLRTEATNGLLRGILPLTDDLSAYLGTNEWRPFLVKHQQDLDRRLYERIAEEQVVIGFPTDQHTALPITYQPAHRFRHTYIIGKTGSGKSTFMRNLITQDIYHGNGVIVLSPENDLFQSLLPFIAEEWADDLIYFDPTDTKPPIIGFNPFILEIGEDLTQKAQETQTILKRALGDLGVTMETLLQNAVYALLECPNSTVSDLDRLLDPRNSTFRRTVISSPNTDEKTRRFWRDYETSNYYKRSYEPVINRLDPFFRPPLATALSVPALSFKTALNTGPHIIFLNLSRLRGIQAETVGQLLIAQIQQALLLRDDIPEQARIPYYLYIDEFQTYAANNEESLITLFNQARKYKLSVTLAHQTTANIPPKLLSTIINNAGTVVALQLAAEDAPHFARELQIKKPERNTPDPEALQNLSTGYGYVRTPDFNAGVLVAIPARPIVPLPDPASRPDELINHSKHTHGIDPDRDHQKDTHAEVTEEVTTTQIFTRSMPEEELQIPQTLSAESVSDDHPRPEPAPTPATPSTARDPESIPKQRRTQRAVTRTPSKRKSLLPTEETIEIE